MKLTTLRKSIAVTTLVSLLFTTSLQPALATFRDFTGSINGLNHTPSVTDTDYYFAFTNEVEIVDGDKIQLAFAPEFTLDPVNSDFGLSGYKGIFENQDSLVVDTVANTMTKTVDLYDGSYGIDAITADAYFIDNPTVPGVYPITIRVLDASDVEKDSGVYNMTIGDKMAEFYASISAPDNKTSAPGTSYNFFTLATTPMVSGESLRIQFPETTDLLGATLENPLMYSTLSFSDSPFSYDSFVVDNVEKTVTFRLQTSEAPEGSYLSFDIANITSLESFGTHYLEMFVLDSGGSIREVASGYGGSLTSPADAANDYYSYYFTPTVPLANGDKIQVDYPAGFELFPGSSEMYVESYNSIFDTVDYPIVDLVENTLTSSFTLDEGVEGIDRVRVDNSRLSFPTTYGVYPVEIRVLNSANVVKETFPFDVIVSEEFFYLFANTDSQSRNADGVTYTIEGEPATPIEDGDTIIVHLPREADISGASITNVSFPNYTGSATPVVTPGYAPNSLAFTASTSAPSGGSFVIEVSGIKNPVEYGEHSLHVETRTAADEQVGVGHTTVTMNPPANSSFDYITLTSEMAGAEDNTFTFDDIYLQTVMESGWEFVLSFPASTDLSQVDPADVTIMNAGFTSPLVTVDNVSKTVTFVADGTYDNGDFDISIADVTNPTVAGTQPLNAEIIFDGIVQERVSGSFNFRAPSSLRNVNTTISTTRPNVVTQYDFSFSTPFSPQDGWVLEVDFDDTMDLSNWDILNDFSLSNCCSLDTITAGDVTIDPVTNTFNISLPYSGENSNNDFDLTLSNLINPTSPGLTNVQLRFKDSLGNLTSSYTHNYYVADRVEVTAGSYSKADQTSYRLAFTPDFDVDNGESFIIKFPSDFDLSGINTPYFDGPFNADATNFSVDTGTNTITFDVDSTFATNPTSQGDEVVIVIDNVKNPRLGNINPYEITVQHVYAGGPAIVQQLPQLQDVEIGTPIHPAFLTSAKTPFGRMMAPVAPSGGGQIMNGYVFFAPPAEFIPSVALSNTLVSEISMYSIDFTPSVGIDSYWVIRLLFPPDTDLSNIIPTTANVRVTGGGLESNGVTVDEANRIVDIEVYCDSCSGGSGNALLNIEVDGVVNATTAGNYTLGMEVYDDSEAGQLVGSGAYTLTGAAGNTAPNAPVDPYVNTAAVGATAGNAGPTTLASTSVVFTAEHSDDDGDAATHYEIEIYSDPALTIPNLVHTTSKTAFALPLNDGERSSAPGISTAAVLVDGETYYWRIRYFDDVNTPASPGAWSTASAFTVDTSAPTLTSTPASGATNVPTSPTFTYVFNDENTPIDTTSLNITVDSVQVVINGVCQPAVTATCTITPTPLDPTEVTVEFTLDTPLAASTLIDVDVSASDTAGNDLSATPNFTTAAPPDVLPPVLAAQSPADNGTDIALSPSFSYQITDNVAVDVSTMIISATVNGGASTPIITMTNPPGTECAAGYTCTLPLLDGDDVTFSFARDTAYSFEDEVEVSITVDDTSGNTLSTSTDFIVRDKAAVAAPSALFSNTTDASLGQVSPTSLDPDEVRFTAVHNDPDGIEANRYRLQVALATNPTFDPLVSAVQDTGGVGIVMNPTADGVRSQNLNPGFTYDDATDYIWRVQFWNATYETAGTYSAVSSFATAAGPDLIPPVLAAQTPGDAVIDAPLSPAFSYQITDNVAVDISTMVISATVNAGLPIEVINMSNPPGTECAAGFTCTLPLLDGSDVTFAFARTIPFSFEDEVEVSITVDDTSGNTLSTSTDFIVRDKVAVQAPENLFSNAVDASTGQTSPVNLDPNTIRFTAIHKDPDAVPANRYRLQVTLDTNPTFDPLVSPVQDTGAGGTVMTSTPHDTRSPNLNPGFTYDNGRGYIWRVQFWNQSFESEGIFSPVYSFSTVVQNPVVAVPVFNTGGGGGGFSAPSTNAPQVPVTTPQEPTRPSPELPVEPEVKDPIVDSCAYFDSLVDTGNIQYTDITDAITNDYANYLLENGIILGRTPTKYGPNELMTRADVLRSLVQARCEKFTLRPVAEKPFPDVAVTHPDAVYIDAAKRADIVSGYKEDGTYRPDRFITRAESLKVVIQEVLGSEIAVFDGPTNPFSDVGANEWYVNYVRFAVATRLIEVPSDGLFYPNQSMSRSEITTLLAKTLQSRTAIIGMVNSGATLNDAIANLGDPVRGSADAAPLVESPRETSQSAPVIPTPLVRAEDILQEPTPACSYFGEREGVYTYQDLEGSPVKNFAEKLLEYGVVIGKEQNAFSPTDVIRRSEILRILIQASCDDYILEPVNAKPFPDVPTNHRDATFIQAAKESGIIKGYGDGTFKPDMTISKAEILKILLETAMGKYTPYFEGGFEPFTDVEDEEWYARYVRYAYTNDLVPAKDATLYEPNKDGNRAFIAETLLKILELRDLITR